MWGAAFFLRMYFWNGQRPESCTLSRGESNTRKQFDRSNLNWFWHRGPRRSHSARTPKNKVGIWVVTQRFWRLNLYRLGFFCNSLARHCSVRRFSTQMYFKFARTSLRETNFSTFALCLLESPRVTVTKPSKSKVGALVQHLHSEAWQCKTSQRRNAFSTSQRRI